MSSLFSTILYVYLVDVARTRTKWQFNRQYRSVDTYFLKVDVMALLYIQGVETSHEKHLSQTSLYHK